MKICVNCKCEMQCHKNGVTALWGKNHGRAGDVYKCPKCNNKTLVTNIESYIVSELLRAGLKAENCLLEMPND